MQYAPFLASCTQFVQIEMKSHITHSLKTYSARATRCYVGIKCLDQQNTSTVRVDLLKGGLSMPVNVVCSLQVLKQVNENMKWQPMGGVSGPLR